jgi:hypothetical protein
MESKSAHLRKRHKGQIDREQLLMIRAKIRNYRALAKDIKNELVTEYIAAEFHVKTFVQTSESPNMSERT